MAFWGKNSHMLLNEQGITCALHLLLFLQFWEEPALNVQSNLFHEVCFESMAKIWILCLLRWGQLPIRCYPD